MTSITQKINSVNGGISQQPDELKIPGQVVSAKNVFPDVTHGLQKRPGSQLIGSLSNNANANLNSQTNGKWFSYYRDEQEQYIGQIYRNGEVKMWRCSEFTVGGVTYPAGEPITVTNNLPTMTPLESSFTRDNNGVITIQTLTDTNTGLQPNHNLALGEVVNITGATNIATGEYEVISVVNDSTFKIKDSTTNSAISVATSIYFQTNFLRYLQHTDDDDIQTLTLNDFTFINNRSKPTAMAPTVEPIQPHQAFIELKQVKYASQYGLELYDSTTNTTEVSTVTRLSVTYNKSQSPNPNQATNTNGTSTTYDLDTDGTCNSVGTELFAVSASDSNSYRTLFTGGTITTGVFTDRGKDLIFRITTTGQPTTTGGDSPSYSCRYTVKIDLLHGGFGWKKNDKIHVRMQNAHAATEYIVRVEEVAISQIAANRCLNDEPIRPTPTPFDGETAITGDMILGKLRQGITGSSSGVSGNDFRTEQIGNGIYVEAINGTGAFNVSTPVSELLNVLTNAVQDVADLPKQCKHGYVVLVRNSANDEDDYYLKFLANNGLSGEGVWEECAEPGRKISFNKGTMPLQLVRTSYTGFTLSQVNYEDCPVGAEATAPEPSFISSISGTRYINKMIFFRNRLVFLSDENVIMSRPGDFFHFWPKSAIAASAEDPIDLSCSSEYPATVFDGIQVNTGLVLFTRNQQFMLTTDSDVLSPLTAKINALSTYNFNVKTNPISLGTTIAFLDNAGKFTRMFEMASVLREGEPVILEQSKVISRLFPKDINLIANSRENSFIVFAEKNGTSLYGFRYFTSGEKRIMQSWITWELSGNIQHLCMLDDAIYAVVRSNGVDVMQKFNLKLSGESTESVTEGYNTYKVYLDNIKSVTTTANSYNADTNLTELTRPNGFTSSKLLAVYDIDAGDEIGQYLGKKPDGTSAVTISNDGTKVLIEGDWSGQTFLLGYLYDMEIEFPKFYVTQQAGDRFISDVQSNLIVHRVKFNFGPLGTYNTTLKRTGKPDYNETFESTFADSYVEGELAIADEQEVTLPVYERNKNYTLTLKSSHPTPATLFSLAWEGDYTNAFYKRV